MDDVRQVLPFYVLCDVSESLRGEKIEVINRQLAVLHDHVASDPMLSDRAHFGVVAFSSDAVTVLPLSDLHDVGEIPLLKAEGQTNYGAAFTHMKHQIVVDVERLKAAGARVYRPVVFFISSGVPTHANWEHAFDELASHSFNYHPNIISFGLGDADPAIMARVGTLAAFQMTYVTTVTHSLQALVRLITSSIVESAGRSISSSEVGLVLPEPPRGFVELGLLGGDGPEPPEDGASKTGSRRSKSGSRRRRVGSSLFDVRDALSVAEAPLTAVEVGVSVPRLVRPGEDFVGSLAAYVPERADFIRSMLAGLSSRASQHMGLKRVRWSKGATVEVALSADGLLVREPTQIFEWNGDYEVTHFDIHAPVGAPERTHVLRFGVFVAGVRVCKLRLDLAVSPSADPSPPQYRSTQAAGTAFASYASGDRKKVAQRASSIEITAGIDVFLDALDLRGSERWQMRLEREIETRDLFLLFWSRRAARSTWVQREWKTALATKGLDTFQIHPLGRFRSRPPSQLAQLQFSDRYGWISGR